MFEFGWAQWAQIVDWLADGGLRNFILDFSSSARSAPSCG
jgi:hypothetical protein